jgi:hypothetical protein
VVEPDGDVARGHLLAQGFQLRTVREGGSHGLLRIDLEKLTGGFGILHQIQIQQANLRVLVKHPGGIPELVFRRLELILRLDRRHFAIRNFRFRAVDVEGRQGAEFQRALVAIVGSLREVLRLLCDLQVLPAPPRRSNSFPAAVDRGISLTCPSNSAAGLRQVARER